MVTKKDKLLYSFLKNCRGTNQKQLRNTEIISVGNTDKWDSESKPIKDD